MYWWGFVVGENGKNANCRRSVKGRGGSEHANTYLLHRTLTREKGRIAPRKSEREKGREGEGEREEDGGIGIPLAPIRTCLPPVAFRVAPSGAAY